MVAQGRNQTGRTGATQSRQAWAEKSEKDWALPGEQALCLCVFFLGLFSLRLFLSRPCFVCFRLSVLSSIPMCRQSFNYRLFKLFFLPPQCSCTPSRPFPFLPTTSSPCSVPDHQYMTPDVYLYPPTQETTRVTKNKPKTNDKTTTQTSRVLAQGRRTDDRSLHLDHRPGLPDRLVDIKIQMGRWSLSGSFSLFTLYHHQHSPPSDDDFIHTRPVCCLLKRQQTRHHHPDDTSPSPSTT